VWTYNGPEMAIDVFKNPPKISKMPHKLSEEKKVSNTIGAFHLKHLDTLAYLLKSTFLWTDMESNPTLHRVHPDETDRLSTGEAFGEVWWFYEEPPLSYETRIPLEEYFKPCKTVWSLKASFKLHIINSLLIRYVGDGDDLPSILRTGGFKPIVNYDGSNDRLQGWEGNTNWQFLKKSGLVRSVFNIHVYQESS